MRQFACCHGLDDEADQAGIDPVEPGLHLWVVVHRQHRLAASAQEGQAHQRLFGQDLGLHDEVERQDLLACEPNAGAGSGRQWPATAGEGKACSGLTSNVLRTAVCRATLTD